MAQVLVNLQAALSTERRFLAGAVGYSFQARCAWLLEPELPYFVFGAEGATVDCGLVVKDDLQVEDDGTKRLFDVIEKGCDETQLLPIDIKTIHPVLCPTRKGGRYFYMFHQKPGQRSCVMFIIQNSAAPHLVALIPRFYLDRVFSSSTTRKAYFSREYDLSSSPVAPFPLEWTAHVMRLKSLPTALKSFYNSYRRSESVWRNPDNNISFDGYSRPVPQIIDLLTPDESSYTQDLAVIEPLWLAFRLHSNRYQIERLTIHQSIGDFQLIHKESGTRMTVELKRNSGYITHGELVHAAGRIPKQGNRPISPFFSPLASWDFLLTSLRGKSNQMLLLSRDDLPSHWFEELPSGEQWLRWRPDDLGFFDRHLVTRDSKATSVHQMEQILDRYASESRLCARKIRPFKPIPLGQLMAQLRDEDDDDSPEEAGEPAVKSRKFRGHNRGWSRRLWEVAQEDWLMKQCRKHKYGIVYQLGRHPSASRVFAPHSWDGDEIDILHFQDLDPRTPMIYLNLAPIDHLDEQNPTDMRRPTSFLHATHGISKSIYLLNSVPDKLDWLPHHRYLVPSETLSTSQRRALNDLIIKGEYFQQSSRNIRPIFLRNNEVMETYATPDNDVVPQLRRILEQPLDVHRIQIGNLHTSAGVEIELAEYVTTQRDVVEQFIALSDGQSYWKTGNSSGSDSNTDSDDDDDDDI